MRIGIEAQRIFRKKKHGMDLMAVELIKNLQALDQVNDYYIFVNPDVDQSAIEPSANFSIVPLKKSPYPIWEQIYLPKAVKEYKIDLLHCTSNTAPLQVKVPVILTLHDIIYLEKLDFKSGTWYQLLGNLYRRWNVPLVVKKSAKILTVSQYEENRIKNYFQLKPKKIEVVYNGIGTHFQPQNSFATKKISKKYNLPATYALFFGNMDPKKNLEGLLKALKILHDESKLTIDIVITDLNEENFLSFLKPLGAESLREKIHLTGYVHNTDLPAVYSKALFFMYPSLRESFGLPILEAMACACPVITSTTSSMPEIAGNAALFVDPFDSEKMSQAICMLINQPKLREKLRELGLKRPPLFSYKSRVERILQIYREL